MACDALSAACRALVASSSSPALALACDALSAACRAFVVSSLSPARALACDALSAACRACLASPSSASRLLLSFIFLLSRRIRLSSSVSFNKFAARLSFLFLASAALKSSSAPFPLPPRSATWRVYVLQLEMAPEPSKMSSSSYTGLPLKTRCTLRLDNPVALDALRAACCFSVDSSSIP